MSDGLRKNGYFNLLSLTETGMRVDKKVCGVV